MLSPLSQYAVIIGTYLAVEHMSTNTDNGRGGVVVNVSSMAGLAQSTPEISKLLTARLI